MNAKDSGVAQVRSRAGVARLEGNLALYLLPAGESPEVPWGILSGHEIIERTCNGFIVLHPKMLHHNVTNIHKKSQELSEYVRAHFLYKSIF